jgi:peroxiredoxin
LRDRYGEFQRKNAEVVVIAMGFPAMAADFRDEYRIPFPVLVDQKRVSYKALGLARGGWMKLVGPVVWKHLRSLLRFGVAAPKKGQDVHQLGGTVVVRRGGEVALVHRAEHAADNATVDQMLAALG